MKKTVYIFLLCLICLFTISGCTKEAKEQTEKSGEIEEEYQLYFMDKDETTLLEVPYEATEIKKEKLIQELLDALQKSEKETEKTIFTENAKILKYKMEENNQLYLYFDVGYQKMTKVYEVLFRTSIVKTLCQIEGIDYVVFFVNDATLLDTNDTPIGPMNAESFISQTNEAINTYAEVELSLYFSNEDGTKLKKMESSVPYTNNIQVEKLIVEKLIAGPGSVDFYPTIPVNTKIVSVSTKENICYVNLSEEFLEQGYDIVTELPIYSIVNSLLEVKGVNKVQILINGETNIYYKGSVSLETVFERNVDFIEVKDE